MLLLDRLSSCRSWVLLGGGVVLLVLLCFAYFAAVRDAEAYDRYRELASPTAFSIHRCEKDMYMYMYTYLDGKKLSDRDEPQKYMISIIEQLYEESSASYGKSTLVIEENLYDAWDRPLHFVFDSKYETGYEIRSAGMDGKLFTRDDIGNWEGNFDREIYNMPSGRVMVVLVVFSIILAGWWGYILLKNNNPVEWGVALAVFATVGAVDILTPEFHGRRGSPMEVFWGVAIFGGWLAAGLLLRKSKRLPVKLLGCVFVGIPLFVFGMIVYVEFLG